MLSLNCVVPDLLLFLHSWAYSMLSASCVIIRWQPSSLNWQKK